MYKEKKSLKLKGTDRVEYVGSSGQSHVKMCLLFILHTLCQYDIIPYKARNTVHT